MPTKEQWAKLSVEQKKVYADNQRAWQARNKDKTRAYSQKARDLYPERERETKYKSGLKRYYGLSYEQYENMLKAQNFKCAICGTEESGSKRTNKLFVDHDHDTNVVRELLCLKCNMALGVFKTVELLEKAFTYLNRHNQKVVN